MATGKLDLVFKKIGELAQKNFIDGRLKPAVKIPSISSARTPEGRQKVYDMTDFLEKQLKALKASVKRYPLGKQPDTDPILELPDVITAKYPVTYDSKKKTILTYGHYDVQPAGDGWKADPWTLQEKDKKLYGRGSTDDKGPVLAWLNALEAYQKVNADVPVNLLFCFEGIEESGSIGFAAFATNNPEDTLMHRFRYPSLTIHGIAGADATPDQTTTIYPKVTGKFSIRTVPSMDGNAVTNLTIHYLEQEFRKLGSRNMCKVKLFGESAPYWLGSPNDANFQAGKAATKRVYKTDPDLTREGGSIGVTLDLQKALGADKSIMLLPLVKFPSPWIPSSCKLHHVISIKESNSLDRLPGTTSWEGERKVSYEACRFAYIQALTKELGRYFTVLRLALPKATSGPAKWRQYIIPDKTVVFLNFWACRRDPEELQDPWNFSPERWLRTSEKLPHQFAFGYGSRMCVASHVSHNALYTVYLHLIAHFRIHPAEGETKESALGPLQRLIDIEATAPTPRTFKARFAPRDKAMLQNYILEAIGTGR
ncbi:hypothetical protein G7Y89_g11120 [Cudoniella acicularis]|uniref:Peptidase M20 dimerisation domain-containing protein n=1 Tax=Cudoniella acicularis TaxID=354080 RepID=A0A8H4RCI7_9HELO|nr:hypothetical protein G7Y89_g11120 [Cudoniella acicularis]